MKKIRSRLYRAYRIATYPIDLVIKTLRLDKIVVAVFSLYVGLIVLARIYEDDKDA